MRHPRLATAVGAGLLSLALVAARGALAEDPGACGAPTPAVEALEAGDAALASDLLAQLRAAQGDANFAYSPFSISAALAMTYAGARGQTANQMAQTLHLTPAQSDVPAAFARIDCQVAADGRAAGNELDIANGLFGQRGLHFEQPFLTLLDQDYGAPLQQVELAGNLSQALQTINSWVSQQTRGLIPTLFQPGDLDRDTRLVLADAIYFKGNWASPFSVRATHPGPFTVSSSSEVEAPLMHQTGRFGYFKGEGLALLELPYVGGKLALDVLLPDAVDGLPALETSFTAEAFRGWVAGMRTQAVGVTLPRFKVDSRFALAQTLRGLGMTDAFNPHAADFSGMDGERNLFIGVVVHQAVVSVDEVGTVAAAATGVGMMARAFSRTAIFDATHPFLFAIRDLATGSLLFVGQVTKPEGQAIAAAPVKSVSAPPSAPESPPPSSPPPDSADPLACRRDAVIPDPCIDDYGRSGAGDDLQLYCVRGRIRACLSHEICPWRGGRESLNEADTCSAAGLPTIGPNAGHLAISTGFAPGIRRPKQSCTWKGHTDFWCRDGQLSFARPPATRAGRPVIRIPVTQ